MPDIHRPTEGARRTLRGRVSIVGIAVIAGWLLLLTVAFNIVLGDQLLTQTDQSLTARAESVAATVDVTPQGAVLVGESVTDPLLDSGVWVYAGTRAVERPSGPSELQQLADSLAGQGTRFADFGGQQRLYVLPLKRSGDQVATVIVALSLAPMTHARQSALWGSSILAALMLAGAYPVLRIATGRALRPMHRMTSQAADWSAHALRQRFGQGQKFQELRSLAHHLDEVLDHLSAVVRHERQLPAELSHELRTPLSRISAETELLLSRPRTPSESRVAHISIQDAVASMQQILDTLLATARAEITEAPGLCSISSVLRKLIGETHSTTPQIRIDMTPADLAAGVEDLVLQRILSPIIDNARRHATNRVQIHARAFGNQVHIDIDDDGAGVGTSIQEKIFDPGFRRASDDGHDGAGLGLALARRLARAAEGDVEVVQRPGGSTFRVRLPAG